MLRRIQTRAVIIVTRVKISPALVPKALEPPIPPKAPARPPPLPRWMSTRQIKKSEVRIINEFRMPLRICTAGVLCPCERVVQTSEKRVSRGFPSDSEGVDPTPIDRSQSQQWVPALRLEPP